MGRQMVEDALKRGHQAIILQRGQTAPDMHPSVERIKADRADIETALPKNFTCDAVIDTCGYHPEVVRRSVRALKGKTKKYIFVSTISVYKNTAEVGITESSETSSIAEVPEVNAKITSENYGPLKALCEQEVLSAFPNNASVILRPTIIAGVGDSTERFDYWMKEVKNKNQVLVPENLDVPFQLIDVRALSDLAMRALETEMSGVFNCLGPRQKTSFRDFLNLLRSQLNPKVEFVANKDPEAHYPLYVADPDWIGLFQVNGQKAEQAGMIEIGLKETIQYRARALFAD